VHSWLVHPVVFGFLVGGALALVRGASAVAPDPLAVGAVCGAFLGAVALAAWEFTRLLLGLYGSLVRLVPGLDLWACSRGAQPRSARFFFPRPLLGRGSPSQSAMKGRPAMSRDGEPSSDSDLLSSHLPARLYRSQRPPRGAVVVSPLFLALVSAEPDGDAFIGGVEVVLSVAFIVIAALIGLSIVRRMMNV
jgi:hypothetical protein